MINDLFVLPIYEAVYISQDNEEIKIGFGTDYSKVHKDAHAFREQSGADVFIKVFHVKKDGVIQYLGRFDVA